MQMEYQQERRFDPRTQTTNMEQLVHESTRPKMVHHHSLMETDGQYSRFNSSSRAGRPMFASAIPKCHNYDMPRAQYAPFISPQAVNHSNSYASNNSMAMNRTNSSVGSFHEQDQSGHNDMFFRSQACEREFQSRQNQYPVQNNSMQHPGQQQMGYYRNYNNQRFDPVCDHSFNHETASNCSMDMNFGSVLNAGTSGMQQRHYMNTSNVQQQMIPGTSNFRMNNVSRQSLDGRISPAVSADFNHLQEETYCDAFINTLNVEDEALCDKEPTSLYMWIIKPVPGTRKICVEGKKSLADENFWHSGEITRRLNEKLLVTQNGSLYKLVGKIEIMDAMAAGFSRKTANAFLNGFPSDWEKVIEEHYSSQVQESYENTGSDSSEEITTIEDDGMDEIVEGNIDSVSEIEPQLENEVEQLENDDIICEEINEVGQSDDIDTEQVVEDVIEQEPDTVQKTGRNKKSDTKDVVLDNWIINFLPDGKGIQVLGLKPNGLLWHSSAVEKRLGKRHLLTSTGTTYKLKGPMDKLVALNEGLPDSIISKFKDGFPNEWQEVIQEFLQESKLKRKKEKKKLPVSKKTKASKEENNKKKPTSEKGIKKLDKSLEKRTKSDRTKKPTQSEKSGKQKTPERSRKDLHMRKINRTLEKKDNSLKRSNDKTRSLNNTPKAPSNICPPVKLYETSSTVITPGGQSIDLENLGRSRSGRLIKPRLQWWTGQRLKIQGDRAVVKTPTLASSMYVRNFEQQYQKTTHRITPYWNPREKDKDYSFCSGKNSSKLKSITEDVDSDTKISDTKDVTSDGNSSIDNTLQLEVRVVLERAKSNRKSRERRETCYGSLNSGGDNECSNPYDLNESDDAEIPNKKVGKKSTKKRLSLKTARAKRQEQIERENEKVVEQENEVSSTTGALSNKEENEIVDNVGNSARSQRSSRRNEKAASVVPKVRPTRYSRRRTLPAVIEDDCEKENSEVGKKSARKETRISTDNEPEAESLEDHWTDEEKERFTDACKTVSASHPYYWENVADMVRTKTAESCKDYYYKSENLNKSVKKKTTKASKKEEKKVTAVTANVGTLRRKQQLRDVLDQQNENWQDDLFDSTPYRQQKKRKVQKLSDLDDDDTLFEKLAKKQGKSRFETPVTSGMLKSRVTAPFASTKKTPKSSIPIEEMEDKRSNELDGYVNNMVKRKLRSRDRNKRFQKTPNCKSIVPNEEITPGQKLMFNKYINEKKNESENFVNSDEEEDYYWEDEATLTT
ncbi:hypothetical protein ACF0H5_002980 [Mactra antiquata]